MAKIVKPTKPIYTPTPKPVSPPIMPPGTHAPRSGLYEEVGPRGGRTGHQAPSTQGKPLPPTHAPDHGWRIIQPAVHTPTKSK
jgi:hypothetical protein